MKRLLDILLLLSALVGFGGQTFARADLPQPVALTAKLAEAPDDGVGMEPPSDLLGEAAMTEAAERADHDLTLLDLISIKGWSIAALAVDPVGVPQPIERIALLPRPAASSLRPYSLTFSTLDPPRA